MSKFKTVAAAKVRTGHMWLQPFYDFVDTITSYLNTFGANAWAPVRAMSASALAANTYNSTAQTKTANANGALAAVDGVTLAVGDRVWLKDEATGSENGLYTVTSLGGASAKWVLTRASDASVSTDFVDGKRLEVGDEGTANGGEAFLLTNATFTLDTDTPAIARETGVVHVDDAQTITGVKKFAALALAVWNAGKTFASKFQTSATADRTITLPDADFTVPQDSLVAHLAGAENFTGAKTFAAAGPAKINNAADTFSTQLASNATANRTGTLPDGNLTFAGINLAATWTALQKFTASLLAVLNGAGTFVTKFATNATVDRTVTFPDADATMAQAAVASGATAPAFTGTPAAPTGTNSAPAFTGTAPTAAENLAAPAFSGTGYATVGQVVTTTDNQTMTLNQCAGMWLLTATHAPVMIQSNTAVSGAPAVLTVYGAAPATTAETYKIVAALTPAGTVAAPAFTGNAYTPAGTVASHTHTQT